MIPSVLQRQEMRVRARVGIGGLVSCAPPKTQLRACYSISLRKIMFALNRKIATNEYRGASITLPAALNTSPASDISPFTFRGAGKPLQPVQLGNGIRDSDLSSLRWRNLVSVSRDPMLLDQGDTST